MSTNQNLMQHMRELIDRIKAADVAYYRDDNPTMTDREYDLLVDELKELEATIGLILSGSPTQTVSGEILKELTPVRHTKPMLSADKTKSVDEMLRFANGRPVVLSWKLDGLTLVLRYEGGEFQQAITRGREGIIGEDTACRNTVIVVEHTEPVWKKHVVQTTEELLDKLRELDGKSISVSYLKSREFTHPHRRRKSNSWDPSKQSGFYVLRAGNGYFSKRSTRRIWLDRNTPPTAASVRKFRTEKAAQRYLDDNAQFFAKITFQIEHIQNGGNAI